MVVILALESASGQESSCSDTLPRNLFPNRTLRTGAIVSE